MMTITVMIMADKVDMAHLDRVTHRPQVTTMVGMEDLAVMIIRKGVTSAFLTIRGGRPLHSCMGMEAAPPAGAETP
jgi:hypothetical protein